MAKGTKTLNSAIKVDDGKNVYIKVKDGDGDVSLGDKELVFVLDEGSGELQVRLTYADGSVHAGTVSELS